MTPMMSPNAANAQRDPAGCAIWQEDRQLSFVELHQRVTALAEYWRRVGIQPGDVVVAHPTGEWYDVVLFCSLWRIAAMVCPLSPRFPARQQRQIAAMLNAVRCLDAATLRETVERAGLVTKDGRMAIDPRQPATVVLTSGSSGTPKAVVHSLAAHVASALGSRWNIPLAPGDRWLASLPTYHVGGLAILVRTILAGASLVIDPTRRSLGEKLRRFGVTHVSVVTTQLRRLLGESVSSPGGLKAILLGGSPYPPDLIQEAVRRGLPLVTSYGLTEMASQVTATSPQGPTRHLETAGRVLPGRELAISPDGEILVRGETLCLGYLQPRRLISVIDDEGWFHTGDIGWLDEEQLLHVIGRRDQMFISGGENIHPEEIELALLSLPGILRSIVVPIEDADFGFRPFAFVEAADYDPPGWTRALRERLSGFKVPVAYRPWPANCPPDAKPSRAWLRSLIE